MELLITVSVYIAILVALIFAGVPIAFALGAVATGSLYFADPRLALALGQITWDGLTSFVLCAIPLFIFMGYLLFEAGLSARIYAGIYPLLDRLLPGGLLHSNIVVGAAFAACSGSSLASCATIGTVAIPEMEKRGYQRGIATGSVAAGGTLGILIPPSISLIIYGAMTDQSVGQLFVGGIIPGIILTFTYMGYIAVRIQIQPHLVMGGVEVEKLPWSQCLRATLGAWPVAALFVGVMGSIYMGIATPTEAAAIGCALTLMIAGGYRLLTRDVMKRALIGSVKTSTMVLCIFWGAKLMGIYLTYQQITAKLAHMVLSQGLSPFAVLMLVVVLYLVLGMLMDALAAMVMTLPLTFPIVMALGYDPIWYGVLLTMLIEGGMLTPPVGMNLFILQGLRPEYPFIDLIKGAAPFFLMLVLVIFVVIAFPELITFLPQTIFGGD
ncbi:MAG: TRAP transporter large permease subunit [Rhodospirillales bacterium]|jgi:tripartite ATP-independent transporter DctM subunit|nr:TRAP transporter large permease subunit [Rhodospirillales bacterium]MDP6773925.1 TRAP transporter large permease subunit [Rhodospirillales bacterium]